MRNRTRRRTQPVSGNLDSFLDTLTNTVGALIFITLFVTLIATGSSRPKTKITIQTPLFSTTKKEAIWFEIKNNKISHLNLRQVREKELELSSNMPNCNKPNTSTNSPDYLASQNNYQSCLMSILGRQSNFRVTTKNYNVKTVDDGVSLLFEPVSPNIGETTKQLTAKDSEFKQVLSQYNSDKEYVLFIVRPDSFETFRAARKQAWADGYQVGWEPQPNNLGIKIRTIVGSELPGGISVGTQ
ncbi:MAG: hypothetical protein ACRC06_01650 [Waterburya sp.]